MDKDERTHLLIPMIPRLRNDRFERRKLLVRHRECPEKVLLEERCTREAEQQSARKSLPAERLALRKRWLVHGMCLRMGMWRHLVRHDGRVLALGVHPAILVQCGHDVVAHVEPELAQLASLDQRAVLALPFSRGGPDAVPFRNLLDGELLALILRYYRLRLLGRLYGWWWLDLDRRRWHLLSLLLGEREDVLQPGLAVALALAALPFCSLLALVSLAGGLVLARPLARRGWR